jgi:hypothetical protein
MKLLALIAAVGCIPLAAAGTAAESWFDQAEAEEARLRQINAGSLEFHATAPDTRIHRLYNRLDIDADSLASGYAELHQCHENLDPIRRAEVSYRYKRMQGLRLESWEGIGSAWVENNSVQMIDVTEGAKLCIRARVGVLHTREGGAYLLRSGPFHRRFLDGYFPMQVQLDIRYPAALLRFVGIDPAPQPGFALRESPDGLEVKALFSGMLSMEIEFQKP